MAGTLGYRSRGYPLEELDQMAAALLEHGPEMIVTTLGRDGAAIYQQGAAPLRQPALPVDTVDTLGAGDAFTAGLVAGLLEGRSVAESLERAAACGAMVCKKVGVFNALPNHAELDAFLKVANCGVPT
jgi:ribokinase